MIWSIIRCCRKLSRSEQVETGRDFPSDIDVFLINKFTINRISFEQTHNVFSIGYSNERNSGGARDSMLPGHSQVNYLANQVKRKSRNTMPPCHGVLFNN